MFGKKPIETAGQAKSAGFSQSKVAASPSPSSALSAQHAAASATGMEGITQLSGLPIADDRLSYIDAKLETADFRQARRILLQELVDKLDVAALERMAPEQRRSRVRDYCDTILPQVPVPMTAGQMQVLREIAVDELLGFGPIEALLKDPEVADILINTHRQIYVERNGKLYITDVTFMDEPHLLGTIQRIVSRVGRRVDEATPMVDARMPDGSRFNAIIPPLALDGCLVSIRKFKKVKLSLEQYVSTASMSETMFRFLCIAANIRLNIIISGGTGSGKTTLLNALSGYIDPGERIVTIEDAAELQLQQPHVLRLETRPASIEGKGEITQRQLVRNALRMRPDRIILGEMRGDEAVDVLNAMNTGHDGSMATVHANTPRDAMTRMENLVAMTSLQVSQTSVRYQIASAVNLIIQIQRMRDGVRRITNIDEIAGMESGNILMQPIFQYRISGFSPDGAILGDYSCQTMRPYLTSRAEMYGRDKELLECLRNSG
jgi:pilus assembly protein CpaF